MMADLEKPISLELPLLLVLGSMKGKITKKEQESILETVEQLLLKAYGNKIGQIHRSMYRKQFVWVIETKECDISKLLFVLALDMQARIQRSLGYFISFVIAGNPVLWGELGNKYTALWTELQKNAVHADNSILLECESREEDFNGEEAVLMEQSGPVAVQLELLKEQLNTDNFELFRIQLMHILEILSQARRHSMYALEIYYSIANTMIAYINRTHIRAELASKIQLMELFDPGSFLTWAQASDYLLQLLVQVEEIRKISNRNNMLCQTERIKNYIVMHLSQDLSLTAIGAMMGFNPIYLSRVFKQVEKISIRDYIENCRMEMAMQLVMNSRMKIYEVAEKCGYQNTTYFIKIFKSKFGKTPQEYRER